MFSARCFYFFCYAGYYFTSFYYFSDLSVAVKNWDLSFLAFSFGLHIIAVILFFTAGKNPGFVKETDTPNSLKEKAKIFVG